VPNKREILIKKLNELFFKNNINRILIKKRICRVRILQPGISIKYVFINYQNILPKIIPDIKCKQSDSGQPVELLKYLKILP
jgi:hypothetical protein